MFGLKFPAGNLVEGEWQSLLWGCCARGPWVFHSGITVIKSGNSEAIYQPPIVRSEPRIPHAAPRHREGFGTGGP
uniref:Uncharacterized protein n=1 Tax=Magallana gigas TaxID=29159 RepID=K1RV36_MAGGI